MIEFFSQAEHDHSNMILIVVGSLMTIYTGVITPLILSLRSQIKKLEEALVDCHKEREEAIIWRATWEPRIKRLEHTAISGRVTAVQDEEGELCIQSSSPGMSDLFGYTSVELEKMPVISLLSTKDRAFHKMALARHKAPEEGFRRTINGGTAIHKVGKEFPVKVHLEVVDFNGQLVWAAEIIREIETF